MLENKFKIDFSKFNVSMLNEFLNIRKMMEESDSWHEKLNSNQKEVLFEFNKEYVKQNLEFYKNEETKRVEELKKGDFLTNNTIGKLEFQAKEILFTNLLKYKDKKKYIHEYKHYINKKLLDRLICFFELENGEYKNKSIDFIKQFKDLSDQFMERIDKKIIDDFNNKKPISENFLFFLHMNEYMK